VAHDPSENLEYILQRLRAVGVGSVIVVPFDTGVPGFAVAKVLVPELEHPAGDRKQRYGRRAVKAMMGAA
jgi:ribosomal protein S12 methylthiotransferase accessory factor